MSELPKGWFAVTLGDLCSKPQYGFTTKSTVEGKVKYLRTTDLTSGKINWDKVPFCITEPDDERYQLEDNDIVISRAGSVGFHCLVKQPPAQTVFASYLIRFKPDKAIFPEYLSLFLRSRDYWEQLKSKAVGVAVQNVNATSLSELVVPVAPLNEQIRIADKLDSVLAKVDAAQARLEKIPALLKRFRQSVLAAAASGELTKEWREGKDILLSQNAISEVYRDGWILETQQDFAAKGKLPKSDSWKEKIPSPYLPSEEDIERFGVFPENWIFVSLDQITRFVKDGPHFSPEYTDEGIPFISGRNVTQKGVELATCKFISMELHEELSKRCKPVKGDILYTKGGTTGIACVNKLDIEFNVWVHVAVLRVSSDKVIYPDFVALVLNSPKCYERSQYYTHGVANRDLGLTRMIKICFAVPHIEEQKEIVRRVESLFAQADAVEKQYRAAKQRLDRLSQSLLAKAFRGELVPQDPNDEPATELLKRIQAERQQQAADKPKRKTGKRNNQNNAVPNQTKTNIMQLKDAPETYLLDLLAQLGGESHAEVLWKKSELAIDDFYAKLKQEMLSNRIVEDKNSPDPALRKLKVANR